MAKLLANPALQQGVASVAKQSSVALREPCASSTYALAQAYHPWAPVVFNDAGIPQSGSWTETVQETGCGRIRTLNVAIIVTGPASIKTTPLLPGDTHASPQLQIDAAPTAFAMALAKAPGCKDAYISETQFDGYGPVTPASPRQPWTERWTFVVCGQTVRERVRFGPDQTGTTYVANLIK